MKYFLSLLPILKYLALLIFIHFFSCSSKDPILTPFFEQRELLGKPLKLNSSLFNPSEIVLMDSLILLNDQSENHLITVIDLNTYNVVTRMGVRGKGPGELLPPINLLTDEDGNIILHSRPLKTVVKYNSDSLGLKATHQPTTLLPHMNNYFDKIIRLTDSSYVGIGLLEGDKRYAKIDKSKGEFLMEYTYPENRSKVIPDDLNYVAFQANLSLKPNKSHFVTASIFCSQFEIFEVKKEIKKTYELNMVDIKWRDRSNGNFKQIEYLDKHRVGFISVATTNKYIYMLYSGRTKGEYKERALQGNTILVYDWNGAPVKKYTLDREVYNLAISQDDNMIFAITREPNLDVVLFNI